MSETILKVVRPFDPAIRWAKEGQAKEGQLEAVRFARERDFATVAAATIEGQKPMVFHTRRLKRSEVRDIECIKGDPNRREVAFAWGVEMVDMPDGSVLRPLGERWTVEELDQHFVFPDVDDVGAVVLQRSTFPVGAKVPYFATRSGSTLSSAILFPLDAPAP